MTKAYEPKDHHQILTNELVEKMEASKLSGWKKPWITVNEMPFNALTGNRYRGVNAVSLLVAGYTDPRFATFKQWVELGEKLDRPIKLKDAKGMGVTVFKAIDRTFTTESKEDPNEQETIKFKRMVYSGTVFNASLIEGLEPYQRPAPPLDFHPHAEAEQLAKAWIESGLTLEHHERGRAFYQPMGHKVVMPNREMFKSVEDYYATLMHEFVHATGPALNRDMTCGMQSASYAKEELVAELGSLFLGVDIGVPYNPNVHENHAAYCESWLKALKNDKEYIFKASSHASRAVDHQLSMLQSFNLSRSQESDLKQSSEVKAERIKVLEMAL